MGGYFVVSVLVNNSWMKYQNLKERIGFATKAVHQSIVI